LALACQEDRAMLGSNPSAWQDSAKKSTGKRRLLAAFSLFGEPKRYYLKL
jgi:hypothetical protein